MFVLRAAILFCVVCMSSVSFAAISDQEFAKCAVTSGDLARLECFDALARSKNLDGPQSLPTNVSGTGKWDVNVEKNPIDDSTTVYLILEAEGATSRLGNPVALVARCKSNKTVLYINWNDYLGSEVTVVTRVGSSKAVTQSWGISTDKKSSFHPNPIAFLKKMLTTNKLVAQVTPYNESPVTAIFDTTGLENAIKPLRKTCSW
jgi:type VI secretion system protein VasI